MKSTCLGFIRLIELLQCLSQSTLCHVDEVFTKLPLWGQGIHVQVFQSQRGNLSFGMFWQLVKSKPATVKSHWFFYHHSCCCGQTAVGTPEEFEVALAEPTKSLLCLILVKNLRSQTHSNIPLSQQFIYYINMALYEIDKIRYWN